MQQAHSKRAVGIFVKTISLFFILVWCSSAVSSQGVTTGNIAGTVTDETGAIIPIESLVCLVIFVYS
jgi:hypothetical protein